MASANEYLRDRILTHHHYLSRYDSQLMGELRSILDTAHAELLQKIARTQGGWTKTWLANTLANVDGIYSAAVDEMQGYLFPELKALARVESRYVGQVLDGITGLTTAAPSPAQLWAAIQTNPAASGNTLGDLFTHYKDASATRVQEAIRQAVIQGETVQELTRRLIGDTMSPGRWIKNEDGDRVYRPAVYAGGILNTSRVGAETLARTSVMHVAHQAHMAVYQENEDIIKGIQVLATLDTRTCPVCGALDGKVFEIGMVPGLPVHPNCRCVAVAVTKSYAELAGKQGDDLETGTRASMDGQVPASQTYGEWLRTQDRTTVEEALGKGKAALFLDKGLLVERFTKDGKVMTLEQLKKAEGIPEEVLSASVANISANPDYRQWIEKRSPDFIEVEEGIFAVKNGQTKAENAPNLLAARAMYQSGWGNVYLLPRAIGPGTDGIKSADARVDNKPDMLFDFKLTTAGKESAVDGAMRKAAKQAGNIIVQIVPGVDVKTIRGILRNRFNRSEGFGEMWILHLDGRLERV